MKTTDLEALYKFLFSCYVKLFYFYYLTTKKNL